jgi:hypothetical protein
MKDPSRLVHEHPSPVARLLLTAAIDEEPSDALLASTLGSIAIGSAGFGIAQAAAQLTGGSTPPIAVSMAGASAHVSGVGVKGAIILVTTVKWVGIASIGGVLALSAARAHNAISTQLVNPPEIVHAQSALGVRASEPVVVTQATALVVQPSSTPSERLSAPAPHRAASAQVPAGSSQPLQLSDEANLIDQAREAVAVGDGPKALRILENYSKRFSQPRLRPEALYLRMQALRLEGQAGAAARVAQRLLAEYPDGPQSAAARAVANAEGR